MYFISFQWGWYERSAKGWWDPGEPMLQELQKELYHQTSPREQYTI